jgi:hypothetical protein
MSIKPNQITTQTTINLIEHLLKYLDKQIQNIKENLNILLNGNIHK